MSPYPQKFSWVLKSSLNGKISPNLVTLKKIYYYPNVGAKNAPFFVTEAASKS